MNRIKLILLAGLVAFPAIAAAVPITIVSQADTWDYNFGTSFGAGGAAGVTFADFTAGYTGTSTGQAAFGNTNIIGAPFNTFWNANTSLFTQKTVNLTGNLTGDAMLNVAIDNGAAIWINGTLVFQQTAGGFTNIWEYTQTVSSSLFSVGDNVISVIANDYGGLTYFDMELIGDVGPITPVPEPTTFALLSLGLLGIAAARWHKKA